MSTATTFKSGDRVRFTTGNLGGLVRDPDHGRMRFSERVYGIGDTGEILNTELPDGWLAVFPDERPDDVLYVPVHPNMIELA